MMNEPIISPLFFYLASRMDAIFVVCVVGIIVGCCMLCTHWMLIVFEEEGRPKLLKYGVTVVIVSAVVLCIIPSEQTLYKMLLAHYATPDNINDIVELIIDGARRIAEATNG